MHTIRLRAAWSVDEAAATRRFNCPTGLDESTRVWLAWDGEPSGASLNGEPLVGGERHEVTDRLQGANQLVFSASDATTRESVRLEIEAD